MINKNFNLVMFFISAALGLLTNEMFYKVFYLTLCGFNVGIYYMKAGLENKESNKND